MHVIQMPITTFAPLTGVKSIHCCWCPDSYLSVCWAGRFPINAHLIYVGESAVGKSSLVLRFVKGQFHEYQESTIGGKLICVLGLPLF